MNYKDAQVRLTIELEGRLGTTVSNSVSKKDLELIKKGKKFSKPFEARPLTRCTQSMTLGTAFIEYACSDEACPRRFDKKEWLKLRKIRRIAVHLEEIASALNGKLIDFKVIE